METFIVVCFFLYIACGFWFMMNLANKIDTGQLRRFVKGDVVKAILFLPFTIFISTISAIVFFITGISKRLDSTKISEWWKSPIRK